VTRDSTAIINRAGEHVATVGVDQSVDRGRLSSGSARDQVSLSDARACFGYVARRIRSRDRVPSFEPSRCIRCLADGVGQPRVATSQAAVNPIRWAEFRMFEIRNNARWPGRC
jgi:hypothetical protein